MLRVFFIVFKPNVLLSSFLDVYTFKWIYYDSKKILQKSLNYILFEIFIVIFEN